VDVVAVRTFVAAAEAGQFQHAAGDLGVTQQAVSKRVGALEAELAVRLFARTPRGVELTVDGQAFLPHARALVRAAERAEASVRPGRRALRVDVISRQVAAAALLREFHAAQPAVELDVVTLGGSDVRAAARAVAAGTVDATFRAVPHPDELPEEVTTTRVLDEPHELLCGPGHRFATRRSVTPDDLVGLRLWIPGIAGGTEWATYYADLAAAFDLTIETIGPRFGTDHLLDVLAEDPDLATLVGARTRILWPDDHDLRRIPVRGPALLYPHCLLWRSDDPHPGLAALRDHLDRRPAPDDGDAWSPAWTR
jgi:DNA-binding transcriptional LysR family regulator